MPRLKLTIAYQGSAYAGWQIQSTTDSRHPPTIQGELERCIAGVTGYRTPVHGSGRTDAGVHAEMQVCHVDIPENRVRVDWRRTLNTRLSPDIRVLDAAWVDDSFHARKSATQKRYAYALWSGYEALVPRIRDFAWSTPPLDYTKIAQAIPYLTGTHDFASFRNSGTETADSVRTLYAITEHPHMVGPLTCPPAWPVTTYIFCANGFLKQMVRNLMGFLVMVGLGKLEPHAAEAILAAGDRRALPTPCAPAHGLTLLEVIY